MEESQLLKGLQQPQCKKDAFGCFLKWLYIYYFAIFLDYQVTSYFIVTAEKEKR